MHVDVDLQDPCVSLLLASASHGGHDTQQIDDRKGGRVAGGSELCAGVRLVGAGDDGFLTQTGD